MARNGPRPKRILSVDIGGTSVKALVTGSNDVRKAASGKDLMPARMVEVVQELSADWEYDAVSLGFPGVTGPHGPVSEPGNLGCGWVGFDFAAAFDRPVKITNDAAMQALGSYDGGRMLFVGLGTSLGSALIAEKAIVPMELGHLPWNKRKTTLAQALCRESLDEIGLRKWRRAVTTAAASLMKAFLADYVVVGGGNAKQLGNDLPHGIRVGHNLTAFRGGFRLWGVEDIPVLTTEHPGPVPEAPQPAEWRIL